MNFKSSSKRQIFFLHFAGGNCFSYNFLANKISNSFDIHQLELPGRGMRMREPFCKNKSEAVDEYVQQIDSKLNGEDFIIYGHSMGASLGLIVAGRLEEKNIKPRTLIVSGNSGPGLDDEKKRHLLENDVFLNELKEIGGMPEDFFAHNELVDLYIPILKSDFKICEEEVVRLPPKINTSIIALMGHLEQNMDRIENWRNYTTSNFYHQILKGNHFFIHDHEMLISRLINNCF